MLPENESKVQNLQEEIARLEKELALSEKKRTEAEEIALAVADTSTGMFIYNTEEQPTGKTITVEECLNPWEKDEKKFNFKEVKLPTYFYKIQLPSGASEPIRTNGVEYHHGQTYEFDLRTLADMKSRVARCWDHEKMIHSDNENAYKKPTHTHFKSASAR
jgi:hypothetical protein